jgi:hypothetical protein
MELVHSGVQRTNAERTKNEKRSNQVAARKTISSARAY